MGVVNGSCHRQRQGVRLVTVWVQVHPIDKTEDNDKDMVILYWVWDKL